MTWIREELAAQASEKLAAFNRKLMPATQRQMLGVKVPVLRGMARRIAQTEWHRWFYDVSPDDSFEEIMLRGMVLGYARMDIENMLQGIRFYIQLIDEWALCDCAVATWKQLVRYPEEAFTLITSYLNSQCEFEQRTAYVMLLSHFCTSTYIVRTLDLLSATEPRGYYATIGLAWAVSVCYLKFPQLTLPLLKSDGLSVECRRFAIQKVIESRRATPEMRKMMQHVRQSIKKKQT